MKHAFSYRLCNSLLVVAMCGFGALSGSSAIAQLEQGNYVFTDQSALLLTPPARVSDDTFSFTWSPDSVRLLTFNIHRVDRYFNFDIDNHSTPESDLEIGRWNKVSRYADVVWKHRYATEPNLSGEPMWIPHTQYLAQIIFWQEKETVPDGAGGTRTNLTQQQELLWINAARSTVHSIPVEMGARLEVSSSRSLAILIYQPFTDPNKPAVLTPVRIDGSLGTPMPLPLHQFVTNTKWTSDGAKLFVTLTEPRDIAKGSVTVLYDPANGEIKTIRELTPSQPSQPVPPAKHDIILKPSVQHIRASGVDIVSHPLWAETTVQSEKPGMLVCTDADLGVMSPDGASIAYRSQHSSWVTVVKAVPIAAFKAMVSIAQRMVAINNAKQLGLAAIMWAEDHDETLPGPSDINSQLMPYLQTDALFNQFTYTYAGGPMSAIAATSETVLGMVDGPGGQAVVYADGHVKWQNR